MKLLCSAAALLALNACGRLPEARDAQERTPAGKQAKEKAHLGVERPRLVVVIVIDQLGSSVLERYLPALAPDGAFQRGRANGAFFWRVNYAYSSTLTGPGHAAIYSGAPPSESGIGVNDVWDRALQKEVPTVADPRFPVYGNAQRSASPAWLRAETVADVLKATSSGRARIASVSLKDRGAVLPAGRGADLVLWYDYKLEGFTTSAFYARARPRWLDAWNRAQFGGRAYEVWKPLDAGLLRKFAGPDDAPGEGNWLGLGTTFPHDPRTTEAPPNAFLATPASAERLLALGQEIVQQHGLGDDDVADLLMISVSTTDYIGHIFGPRSWEYVDCLIRLDRALAAFLKPIEARQPTSVLITSDHGVAEMPEQTAAGSKASRISPKQMAARLRGIAESELGAGVWVDAFVEGYVYFSLSLRARGPERERLIQRILKEAVRMPEVAGAYDVRDAERLRKSADPLERAAGLSIPKTLDADVLFVPKPGYFVDPEYVEGFGTNHGSPWPYDREVPVLFWGPGVSRYESRALVAQERVAPTIARLLGVRAPGRSRAPALPGFKGVRL